jgi:hypothetical protein
MQQMHRIVDNFEDVGILTGDPDARRAPPPCTPEWRPTCSAFRKLICLSLHRTSIRTAPLHFSANHCLSTSSPLSCTPKQAQPTACVTVVSFIYHQPAGAIRRSRPGNATGLSSSDSLLYPTAEASEHCIRGFELRLLLLAILAGPLGFWNRHSRSQKSPTSYSSNFDVSKFFRTPGRIFRACAPIRKLRCSDRSPIFAPSDPCWSLNQKNCIGVRLRRTVLEVHCNVALSRPL